MTIQAIEAAVERSDGRAMELWDAQDGLDGLRHCAADRPLAMFAT